MECKKCGALGGPGRPFDRSRSWVACSKLAALLMAKIHCFKAHQPKIPQGMDWCFFKCSKVLKYSASFFKNSSVPFINHHSEWFKVSNHILPLLFIHQTTTINLSLVITSLLNRCLEHLLQQDLPIQHLMVWLKRRPSNPIRAKQFGHLAGRMQSQFLETGGTSPEKKKNPRIEAIIEPLAVSRRRLMEREIAINEVLGP